MRFFRLSLLVILLAVVAVGVWSWKSDWLSRLMLSHSVGFAYRAVSLAVLEKLPKDASLDERLVAIRDYVCLTVQPTGRVGDFGPTRVLINGQGWCDQVSDIYIRLIEPLNVRGYLMALLQPDNLSPHSLVYLTPDSPGWGDLAGAQKNLDKIQAVAMVVDPQNGLTFRKKDGSVAHPPDICKKDFADNPIRAKAFLFCRNPDILMINQPSRDQGAIKRFFYAEVLPLLPKSLHKSYLRLAYALGQKKREPGEREYLSARIDHVFFDLEQARAGYEKVIKDFPKSHWANLARHYILRSRQLEKRFPPGGGKGPMPPHPPWIIRKKS